MRSRLLSLSSAVMVVLLGFILLISELDAVALSGDEIGNVLIETGDLTQIFASMFTAWSQHPPVSHIVMGMGLRLFGTTDFGARATSVLISTLNLALIYQLARRLYNRRVAVWSAFTLATAPTFILYGRMEKYYALQIALALLLHIQFLSWSKKCARSNLVVYGSLLMVMWYTDYLAAGFIIVIHFLWLLLSDSSRRRLVMRWAISAATSTALLIPWIPVLRTQAASLQNAPSADLASGVLGCIAKIAFFFYSYGIGETVFPWEITAILSALIVAVLIGASAWRLPRLVASHRRIFLCVGLGSVVPMMGLTALSCTPLLATVPLITLPNHVIFALPLFRLLLVGALDAKKRWLQVTLIMLAVLGIPTVINIYRGTHYLNPAHANPSREAVQYLVRQARPGDIVIADEPALFSYYFAQYDEQNITFIPADSAEATQVPISRIDRLWVITIGRDRTRSATPAKVLQTIENYMQLASTRGFGEQDPTYRALKQWLTEREAYQYRVLVRLYKR